MFYVGWNNKIIVLYYMKLVEVFRGGFFLDLLFSIKLVIFIFIILYEDFNCLKNFVFAFFEF